MKAQEILIAGALLTALAACGKGSEEPAEKSSPVPQTTAHVTTGSHIPAGVLPSYMPIYPGAQVIGTLSGQRSGGVKGLVSLSTSDEPQKIAAFYRKALTKAGLKITLETTTADANIIAAQESDSGKRIQVIASNTREGKTIIQLIVSTD